MSRTDVKDKGDKILPKKGDTNLEVKVDEQICTTSSPVGWGTKVPDWARIAINGIYPTNKVSFEEVNNFIQQQEEVNMSNATNRRVVTIQLIDPDVGLPVEHSLVGQWEDLVTEDNNELTIQQFLIDYGVAEVIEEHNNIRAGIINEDILNRTGNEVYLRKVKFKDLKVIVK